MATSSAAEAKIATPARFQKLNDFWKRLKVFLKEPKHWFPLLGAFLVFVTFVVKENVRENAKDALSAFEAAQANFDLRNENAEITQQIAQIERRVADLNSKALSTTAVGRWRLNGVYRNTEQTKQSVMLLSESLEKIVPLAQKLPPDARRDAELAECRSLLAKTGASYLETVGVLGEVRKSLGSSMRNLTGLEEQRVSAAETVYIGAQQEAAIQIAAFETNVLQEAPKYREGQERRYAWWNRASIVLYTVGWLLALIGKFCGIDVTAS